MARKNQAFAGAHSAEYPVLNRDFIEFLLNTLKQDGFTPLPSKEVTLEAFKTLGSRPEEIIRALGVAIRSANDSSHPDDVLPAIALALRTPAADVELSKVESLGPLAEAIFDRVVSKPKASKGLFSAEAAADYSQSMGRVVRIEEIQPVAMDLLNANLLLRRRHGLYEVSDPFVGEAWLERKKRSSLSPFPFDPHTKALWIWSGLDFLGLARRTLGFRNTGKIQKLDQFFHIRIRSLSLDDIKKSLGLLECVDCRVNLARRIMAYLWSAL